MKRALLVVAIVAGLLVPATPALAWGSRERPSTPSVTSTYEMRVLDWISDNVALTKIPLRPSTKAFLNRIINFIGPSLCPIVAGMAAADFQEMIAQVCDEMVRGPDPLGLMIEFLPTVCDPSLGLGEMVFPDYAAVLPILCGILV